MLKIVCGYHSLPLPPRGAELVFQPLDHLQPIKYQRPGVSDLELYGSYANLKQCDSSLELAEVRPLVIMLFLMNSLPSFEPIIS